MGQVDEDIKHELKMIARELTNAQARLAKVTEAFAAEGHERGQPSSPPAEMSEALKAECEAARERVRKVMRAPGYVPKYR